MEGISEQVDGVYSLRSMPKINGHPTWTKEGTDPMIMYTGRTGKWHICRNKEKAVQASKAYVRTREKHEGIPPYEMSTWGRNEDQSFVVKASAKVLPMGATKVRPKHAARTHARSFSLGSAAVGLHSHFALLDADTVLSLLWVGPDGMCV